MTLKQLRFIKEYLKNDGNGTKAALAVYGTKDAHTAHQIAYENLRKPVVIQELKRNLEKLGLSDEFLDGSVREIIESGLANKEWSRPADALTAIEMANKLKDRFPASKVLTASLQVTAELEGKDTTELVSLLKNIQEENKKLMERVENTKPTP